MFCCGRIRNFSALRRFLGFPSLGLFERGRGHLVGVLTLSLLIAAALVFRRRYTHHTKYAKLTTRRVYCRHRGEHAFLPVLVQRAQSGLPSSHLTLRTVTNAIESDRLIY